jgi:fucose 4-O-acetylase-like acetyltransferase
MKINNAHLTYCTNIHKNKTWEDAVNSIKKYTINIKNKINPNKRFGIGLCLSFSMSQKLIDIVVLKNFQHWLNKNNLYIFTINGFVFSYFHKKNIKEKIYEPDWSTQERFIYTKNLITILSNLLDTEYGSISTVPICYKKNLKIVKKNTI